MTPKGKWSQQDIPHKGWSCVGITDLEEPAALCEMCEAETIRYVHHMIHPETSMRLAVGCICAGHMEQNYLQARTREHALKNTQQRRSRWLTRPWRTSRNGNIYLRFPSIGLVCILCRNSQGHWMYLLKKGNTLLIRSEPVYATQQDAVLAAFLPCDAWRLHMERVRNQELQDELREHAA